jgi:hypothetical protein
VDGTALGFYSLSAEVPCVGTGPCSTVAICFPGDTAVGGGEGFFPDPLDAPLPERWTVIQSVPNGTPPDRWSSFVDMVNSPAGTKFRVFVVCADTNP